MEKLKILTGGMYALALVALLPQDGFAQARGARGAILGEDPGKAVEARPLSRRERSGVAREYHRYKNWGYDVDPLRQKYLKARDKGSKADRNDVWREVERLRRNAEKEADDRSDADKEEAIKQARKAADLLRRIDQAEKASKSRWTWDKKYYRDKAKKLTKELEKLVSNFYDKFGNRRFMARSPYSDDMFSFIDGGQGLEGALKAAQARSHGWNDGLKSTGDEAWLVPGLGLLRGFSNAAARKLAQQGTNQLAQQGTRRLAQQGTNKLAQQGTKKLTQQGTNKASQATRKLADKVDDGLSGGPKVSQYGKNLAKKPGGRPAGLTRSRVKGRQGSVNMPKEQVQHAFKHAGDFGVKGLSNAKNLANFEKAMRSHISDAGTKVIQGTYRGSPVTHYLNPQTGLNVIARNGKLLSGWKLSPSQLKHVLKNGKLGGG